MKGEGVIKNSIELVIREISGLISFLYLIMIGVGMLFNHAKYREFDINIFQYVDILDFLVVPFEDASIFLFVIGSTLLTFLFFRFDVLWRKKWPKSYSKAQFWN